MNPSAQPSEVQALLRYALNAPAQLSFADTPLHSTKDEDFNPPEGDKRFKKVIDGIHFSKKFILSYQLVLVGLLLLFTAIHSGSRLRAWRGRRRGRTVAKKVHSESKDQVKEVLKAKGEVVIQSRSSGSSSSSSTLAGDQTPGAHNYSEEPDEQTSLLRKHKPAQSISFKWLPINNIKAWLIYQPRPIPIINKTLPSNGITLAGLAFTGLQIFYTFFKIPFSKSMLFVFADRTSLLFVANLPLLYLFAAKNQPIRVMTGYSYEALNIFHRRLGEVMCLLALLHSLGMIGVWYIVLRHVGITLIKFLLIKMILLGIGAFIAYELIYFTSLGSFRQRWYELFLGLHVVLQATALILVFFHHHGSRPYVGVALAIFLIDRVVYRIFIKSLTVRAVLNVKEDGKTVTLRAPVPLAKHRSLISYLWGASNIKHGWKGTEHVFLTVPSLARKHIIQAHPFTIASEAPSSDIGVANLELLIRGQDGFSADLVRCAQGHNTTTIRLDGPYGSQSAVHMLQDSDHVVIVAGGSGIAVTWPLVWSTLEGSRNNDLEHSVHAPSFRKILFVWIIREQSHVSWLGEERIKELRARGVGVEIPPSTAERGHPDIGVIIRNWIACFENETVRPKIGVVASGPDGLNRAVRNTCASLVRQGEDVNVEVEKFGW